MLSNHYLFMTTITFRAIGLFYTLYAIFIVKLSKKKSFSKVVKKHSEGDEQNTGRPDQSSVFFFYFTGSIMST